MGRVRDRLVTKGLEETNTLVAVRLMVRRAEHSVRQRNNDRSYQSEGLHRVDKEWSGIRCLTGLLGSGKENVWEGERT